MKAWDKRPHQDMLAKPGLSNESHSDDAALIARIQAALTSLSNNELELLIAEIEAVMMSESGVAPSNGMPFVDNERRIFIAGSRSRKIG